MPIDRPIGNERKSDREKPKQKRIVNKSSRTDTHEGSCGVIRRQKIKSPTGTLSWFFFFFLYLVPNDGSSVPLEFLFLSSPFDCFLLLFFCFWKGFIFRSFCSGPHYEWRIPLEARWKMGHCQPMRNERRSLVNDGRVVVVCFIFVFLLLLLLLLLWVAVRRFWFRNRIGRPRTDADQSAAVTLNFRTKSIIIYSAALLQLAWNVKFNEKKYRTTFIIEVKSSCFLFEIASRYWGKKRVPFLHQMNAIQ